MWPIDFGPRLVLHGDLHVAAGWDRDRDRIDHAVRRRVVEDDLELRLAGASPGFITVMVSRSAVVDLPCGNVHTDAGCGAPRVAAAPAGWLGSVPSNACNRSTTTWPERGGDERGELLDPRHLGCDVDDAQMAAP